MSDQGHKLYPHGNLEALASNLWLVRGAQSFPLPRNMIVYKLADGTLMLHSVVAMDEDGMKALEALGKPAVLVAPHGYHRMDAGFYKRRYPDIKVACPAEGKALVEDMGAKVDGTPDEILPPLGVRVHEVPGVKHGEVALEVDIDGGKALIMSDTVGAPTPGEKPPFMIRLMGPPGGGIGVPRIYRWRMVADKAAIRSYLEDKAKLPGLKLATVSHGPPLTDPATALRSAAATI